MHKNQNGVLCDFLCLFVANLAEFAFIRAIRGQTHHRCQRSLTVGNFGKATCGSL